MVFRMENDRNMDSIGRHDHYTPEALDQREYTTSLNDVMTARRMKNRERQRRYRARKRQEADTKNSNHVHNQPTTTLQVQPQHNWTRDPDLDLDSSTMPKPRGRRNWKKDARRAHMYKAQNSSLSAHVVDCTATTSNGSETLFLTYGVDSEMTRTSNGRESCLKKKIGSIDIEMRKTTHRLRNWKADARNKKN